MTEPTTTQDEWKRFLGIACTCDLQWRALGVLYGVSMGHGWVRVITAPDCEAHRDRA